MAENKTVWEKRVGNLLLRKFEGPRFNVTVEDKDGKQDKGEVTVHFITLANTDHSFEVTWREDTTVFQLIEACMENESRETDIILESIALTTFAVGSTADVCREYTTKDGKKVVDGLRLSVQTAVADYIERQKGYEPAEDEPEEKIIQDMRAQYEAQKALDEMKGDE
jgi:hypothetical protein